jgi:hypothetical protein
MSKEKKLLRQTKQCAKCPWKKETDNSEIPGYSKDYHENLECKLSFNDNSIGGIEKNQYAMACHESKEGDDYFCVGWLVNQLGEGNNILLRLAMLNYSNASELEVYGQQYSNFKDSLNGGD